ncbi:MAG: hypothetical protein HFF84_13485 [Oscillibacter sp.]|nr:hypothetical protein [Oscillibacter sp.]
MGKKFGYTAFITLILLLCLVPSLGMLLPREEAGAGGNQVIAPSPSWKDGDGNLNKAYFSQLLDYVEDNHFLHQEMISAWSALNVKALHTSIAENVILGKNNWLYFGETLPDYTGTGRMTEQEISAAARNLALMAEYCENQGMQFLFTVAPNKNSLYPENMPEFTVASGARNAETLAAALEKEGVPYLDLFAVFRNEDETLYFTQDSHWNSKGAALAADAVNGALGRASSYFEGPFAPAETHRSDLYEMLCPTGTDYEVNPEYSGALDFTYDVPIRSAENLTIMTTGSGGGSLLMFRDSFGNLLYPYLADSFEHALFSRATAYRLDLAAQREADAVVVELVERNLGYLLQNVPVMPAPVRELPEGWDTWGSGVGFELEPSDALPGYALFTGPVTLNSQASTAPDAGPPILVFASDSQYYEAFVLEDGRFGLYLPEDVRPLGISYNTAA